MGGWVSVPVSAAGLKALSSRPGARLTVTATPAGVSQPTPAAPSATPTATTAPSRGLSPAGGAVLMVTAAGNGTPQINNQWPTNGYNTPTLTPELIASASDSDGDTLDFDFTVYSTSGATLANSGRSCRMTG